VPTNKKNIIVHQTAAGRAFEKRLEPLVEDTNRISITQVAPADVATARRILLAMIANLAENELSQAAQAQVHASGHQFACGQQGDAVVRLAAQAAENAENFVENHACPSVWAWRSMQGDAGL
jgi:hypothetical protein